MTQTHADFITGHHDGICFLQTDLAPDHSKQYYAGFARAIYPNLCDLHKTPQQIAQELYPEPPSDPATT